MGQGVDADFIGHGKTFQLGHDDGDALGQFSAELTEIAQNRGEAESEEKRESEDDSGDKKNDGYGAGGRVSANGGAGDTSDDRHENDGEEGADVDHLKLAAELPSEGEKQQDGKGEEDVAADTVAGRLFLWCEVGCRGGQGLLL